jgi:dTDP-4-amino-4,6-dideoxygalactose transaminase
MLPFIDLGAQRRRMGAAVDEAILKVVHSGAYIMGPEVFELERQLSAFCGAKHTLSCANGTDALALVLMAKGVRPGQAVLCPSFTFAATAEVVAWLGATAVFVDVDEATFNIDPTSLSVGIETAKAKGLKPVGVIAVDLFGLPADYAAIEPICRDNGLWLLCDAAQSFGAEIGGRKVGTIGMATSTSFFPAKPLGCYGDGGAVFTEDDDLIDVMKSLRVHGQANDDKYENVRVGMNGRLDTIQAAVLIEKLKIFADEIVARNTVAARYAEGLHDVCAVPSVPEGSTSVWAQYTIRLPKGRRAGFMADLKDKGVPTAIYYPKPLHMQTAYKHHVVAGNGLAVTERIMHEVVALPMHPYLEAAAQATIVDAARASLKAA